MVKGQIETKHNKLSFFLSITNSQMFLFMFCYMLFSVDEDDNNNNALCFVCEFSIGKEKTRYKQNLLFNFHSILFAFFLKRKQRIIKTQLCLRFCIGVVLCAWLSFITIIYFVIFQFKFAYKTNEK
eukprot:TRINITY_DN7080_c0_g4_i1.p1 TRINITY_DN7080_c0_g4~~TRINITY_DN7080_c0_g4_i1.p1  ORF type:complete len:126 (+),score=20.04 TRINITY_DN7080_c0_g4_i1:237-614(+)